MKALLALLCLAACGGNVAPAQVDAGTDASEQSSLCAEQCRELLPEGLKAVRACMRECTGSGDAP